MTITSLSGIGGLTQPQTVRSASIKLQAAISNIVSGHGSTDVANVSIATQLQSQTATLRQASNNLAQASSLTQIADGGSEQIQNALIQLQSLAQQANSPTLNPAIRSNLNLQFQQLVSSITRLAQNTSLNGQKLLDGSLSGGGTLSLDSLLGSNSSGNDTLSIPDLSGGSLLSGAGDISTPEGAAAALGVVNNAINEVTGTRAAIGSFQQTIGFADASIGSAINNFEAANSTLSDTDLATASTQKTQDEVLQNAAIALLAQGNKLNPALLQLVG